MKVSTDIAEGLSSDFHRMPELQRHVFLAKLSHELTVIGRLSYSKKPYQIDDSKLIMATNEMQHRLMGHLYQSLAMNTERYPDEVLFRTMLE